MAKDYGADRTVGQNTEEYSTRQKEVDAMLASGKYESVEMSKKGGGYVAIEKSNMNHKPEEIEAANYMADAGYKVILTDEGGHGVSADGKVFNFVYEQSTPNPQEPRTKESLTKSVKNALQHGVEKVSRAKKQNQSLNIDVAVIYDKYHSYHESHIEAGIKEFEKYGKFRYKRIIVVSQAGNVYEHRHNDK